MTKRKTDPAPAEEITHLDTSGEAEVRRLAIVRDYGGELAWPPEDEARAEIAEGLARAATAQDLAVVGRPHP